MDRIAKSQWIFGNDIIVLNKPGKLTDRPGNDKRITVSVDSVNTTLFGTLKKVLLFPRDFAAHI